MSDQTTPTTSEAPDGATQPGATPGAQQGVIVHPPAAAERDPNEVMSRSAFEKLVAQRDGERSVNKALAAELAELKSKAAAPKPDAQPLPKDSSEPAWLGQLNARLDGLDQKLEGQTTARATEAALKSVLGQVPDGNHATVKALLPTLGVDLTSPTAAADALALLRTNHPAVMADQTRSPMLRSPQPAADGKFDFSACKTIEDIPPELHAAAFADPVTLARIRGNLGGGSTRETDGVNI